MKTLTKGIFAAGAMGAVVLASGVVDVDFRIRDGRAGAFEFFGKEGKSSQEALEPFWKEQSGQEPIVPVGVPASFADLAERVSPGVVNISTEKIIEGQQRHPFEEFFHGTPMPFPMPFGMPGPFKGGGQGTGFVISDDGYIAATQAAIGIENSSVSISMTPLCNHAPVCGRVAADPRCRA